MKAENRVAASPSTARARDEVLLKIRQLVQRHPVEARDAGRRLDCTIRRAMNEAHAAKQLGIRTECQLLEIARVLAIEFLETEGPPGFLRPVEVPKGTALARIHEAMCFEPVVPEGLLRAVRAVEHWGRHTSEHLWLHVARFVVGAKGKYAKETSPGVWKKAPAKTPLDLRSLTGPEAYVQWYIQGKLAFNDTDFDEDAFRKNLQAEGAENAFATPAMQVRSLLTDIALESEFLIRSREKWWDVVVLVLVLRDPDLQLQQLAIESPLPPTSTRLFFGLDVAQHELDTNPRTAAAFWSRAAQAVEYLQTPLKIPTGVGITEEPDPTKPGDSLAVFVNLSMDLRERSAQVAASTRLEKIHPPESDPVRGIEVPSYERKRGVEGLDDRLEILRTLATTILEHAPTDGLRKALAVKTGAVLNCAKDLSKAVLFARHSSDIAVAKALDALNDATLDLRPSLTSWACAWATLPMPEHPSAPQNLTPDPWTDTGRTVNERVYLLCLHYARLGKRTRPPSEQVAEWVNADPTSVRNCKAWKTWKRLGDAGSTTGGLLDAQRGRHGRGSNRVIADRIRHTEEYDE